MRFAQTPFLFRARPPLLLCLSLTFSLYWLPRESQVHLAKRFQGAPLSPKAARQSLWPRAQPRLSAFLANSLSLTASHCKHSASVSGNLCIRQFPGPPRSKFGLANSCPPIKAWQSEGRGGGKNKWPLAIGRTHFEGRARPL